jgi:predicted transcriptional regulator
MSYQQLLIRQALEGEPVSRFMKSDPVTVPGRISIQELVDDYIYKHHFKRFPVADNGTLHGCISTRQAKAVSRGEWNSRTVASVAEPCSPENTIRPETDAVKALARMNQTGVSRLMVVDDNRLIGIIALKDLLNFLSLKIELEEETT